MEVTNGTSIDYPYLRAWEDWIGVGHLTLQPHLTSAREANAPDNAVFYDKLTSKWVTFDEITNTATLINLKRILNNSYGFQFPKDELIW